MNEGLTTHSGASPSIVILYRLAERILGGIVVALREVVIDLVNGDAHVLENLPEVLALMAEHNGAVMWIVLLDEDVTIEAAHVLDAEDTDRTERTCSHWQNLALSNVGAQLGVGRRLQAVDGGLSGLQVALQGAIGNLYRQGACHDALEAHRAVANLVRGCVAAVEAHEDLFVSIFVAEELLALDALLVHVGRNGVVDVEQGDGILGDAGADKLRQRAIDVHLAAHGDAVAGQSAVHIAGHEAEHGLESRPALGGQRHKLAAALVSLHPVGQGEFVLGELGQHLRNLVASAELGNHILHHVVDAGIAGMLLERLEQVELRVLFNLYIQVIEGTDGSIAGQEVVRTRTEADDLQVTQADDGTSDRQELMDQFCTVGSVADGLLRDIGARLAQRQGMAGIQHAAVGITTTVDEVLLGLFGSGAEHGGAIEIFGQHGLGDLRSEVAKIYTEGIATSLLDILKGLAHVNLALDDTDGALVDVCSAELLNILGHNSLTAVNSQ